MPRAAEVAVVIPTYKRPEALARCLASLAEQSVGRERFEVVVVDDGSGAPPHDVIAKFADSLHVTLHARANGGPGAARNTGVQATSARYIAFIDDDCTADVQWLEALLRASVDNEQALIGGRVENALTNNAYAEASQLLTGWLIHWYSHPLRHNRRTFTTNNMLFARDSFIALGGFDVDALADTAEDRDLCDRWRGAGWPLVYVEDAVVRHAHRMSLRGYVSQHHNYGRGAVYFHQAAGRNPSEARKPESIAFYVGMLRWPYTRHAPVRATHHALLLLLSQVVYVGSYFMERVWPIKRR